MDVPGIMIQQSIKIVIMSLSLQENFMQINIIYVMIKAMTLFVKALSYFVQDIFMIAILLIVLKKKIGPVPISIYFIGIREGFLKLLIYG